LSSRGEPGPKPSDGAVARLVRLSCLFFLIGLTTSRLTLVAHELGGHALPALAVGSTEVGFELFWFAGGYVTFQRPEAYDIAERLFISLGGIGLELIMGLAGLWLARVLRRRRGPGSVAYLAVFGFATINLVHGLYYLATGAFHGFGDGWLLHRELGSDRWWVAVPAALLALVAGYFCARVLGCRIRSSLPPAPAAAQVATIGIAVLLAAGLHAALSFGEVRLRADRETGRTYTRVMKHQSAREVERDLARYLAEARRQGARLERREIEQVKERLEDQHRELPFAPLLGVGLGIACLIGVARGRPEAGEGNLPAWRRLTPLALLCAASVLLVVVL
jgi:hypothetical protein